MWNKSTRYDIQDMFAELSNVPDIRGDGADGDHLHVTEQRHTTRGPGRPAVHTTEEARVEARRAKHRRYNTSEKGRARDALRVAQRAADLDVVDCAAQ